MPGTNWASCFRETRSMTLVNIKSFCFFFSLPIKNHCRYGRYLLRNVSLGDRVIVIGVHLQIRCNPGHIWKCCIVQWSCIVDLVPPYQPGVWKWVGNSEVSHVWSLRRGSIHDCRWRLWKRRRRTISESNGHCCRKNQKSFGTMSKGPGKVRNDLCGKNILAVNWPSGCSCHPIRFLLLTRKYFEPNVF